MPSILDKIVATKREEILAAKARVDIHSLQKQAEAMEPARDFYTALRGDRLRLIAEVKKASPSKGIIRADFEPLSIARQYVAGGASALSVLTDEQYFQGSLDYLRAIRREVSIPLLRKDFVLDPYQVVEARAAGADAVLLIAECLDAATLKLLYDEIRRWGMWALIELYDPQNLPMVLDTGTQIVGVNNRDLHSFEVDLDRTIEIRKMVESNICVVGESGISSVEDMQRLSNAGVQAVLVGESLMRQENVQRAAEKLLAY